MGENLIMSLSRMPNADSRNARKSKTPTPLKKKKKKKAIKPPPSGW